MDAKQDFDAGELAAAVESAAADVRKQPTDARRRFFFAELLCFQGEWERADKQLETLAQQNPDQALNVAVFRQLIRGEVARQEVFNQGRAPEFLTEPSPLLLAHAEALVALRESDAAAADRALERADELRGAVSGTHDGEAFDDIRDLDDLTASFLELVTTSGNYCWLPFQELSAVKFDAPRRPRDLIWRAAHVELRTAVSVDVFVPALYAATWRDGDDAARLGRATHWTSADDGPVRGSGLRILLLGERDRTVLELNEIRFNTNG